MILTEKLEKICLQDPNVCAPSTQAKNYWTVLGIATTLIYQKIEERGMSLLFQGHDICGLELAVAANIRRTKRLLQTFLCKKKLIDDLMKARLVQILTN